MGRLVLTRRNGESVQLTDGQGDTWLLTVTQTVFLRHVRVDVALNGATRTLRIGESLMFAGGNVELRPHKHAGQTILAFDFPADVKILRTELL